MAGGAATGSWKPQLVGIGSLIAGVVGGEGIIGIGGIDRIARRNIGIGIATGAVFPMFWNWVGGVGSSRTDLQWAALIGSVIAFALSYTGDGQKTNPN